MGRFKNETTGVVVSVDDSKDHRFTNGWKPAGDAPKAKDSAAKEPTVAELRAEIERRNEGRDEADLLSIDGKKADLLAAIEADDAASASTEA